MVTVDELITNLEFVSVDSSNILHYEFTIPERDLITDALILYKEMN